MDIIGSFGRPQSTLGDPASDVQASIGPYAPFNSAAQAAQAAGLDTGSKEGQLATSIMSDLISGNHIDVEKYAAEAGQVAGAAAGTAFVPGIGTIVGGIVGGTIGKALGGLVGGGGGGCDCVCDSLAKTNQIAPQICTVRTTGQVDGACRDKVYNVLLDHCSMMFMLTPCGGAFGGGCFSGYTFMAQNDPHGDGRWHAFDDLIGKYGIPLDRSPANIEQAAYDANEALLKARLGDVAAQRRLADDVDWSQKLIVAANSTAAKWAPQCPSCEPACVHLVKKYAVDYATAAHPYGIVGDESVTEGFARTSMEDGMASAIATDKTCPKVADLKINIQSPGDAPVASGSGGHGVAFKAVAAIGAAAALYSAVQFARKKPNLIVDESKKIASATKKLAAKWHK
jgi:hypothetical protein